MKYTYPCKLRTKVFTLAYSSVKYYTADRCTYNTLNK